MKDKKLKPAAAKLFSQLNAGEPVADSELQAIRNDVWRLLQELNNEKFSSSEPAFRDWFQRQQDYVNSIISTLEREHFRRIASN